MTRSTTTRICATLGALGLAATAAVGAATTASASTGTAAAAPAQAAVAAATSGDVVGIPSLDVSRYLGSWYQYAAVPAVYELQCAKDAKAQYSLTSPTTVKVVNTCSTWLGRTSSVTGEAKVLNAPASSELNVSFLKIGGSWLHFGGANYVVVGVGSSYDWAVVGDPSHASGFVLSRTPNLTADQLTQVRATVVGAGYDLSSFRLTPQTGGQSSRGTLG
ncbi:lipocalin family protein [Luteimicrobium subarcticum]|uniref:Apolipoprotein D and lipocalin family protein n=1 Tax=Luteimicrobium subarcticum TaxID=620910 RepID=A0A2M8WW67_9MICO|nr:lipocalin family protein [Luteimicrobium subarcticum]PJI95169.1 apolipoprotein D and lipocalin family protein [Luteimicrobium subarcticum]